MVNDLVDQGEPDKKSLFKIQNKSADKEFLKKIGYPCLFRDLQVSLNVYL